jgi:lipoprotein-anchoring transpeptidase ErfK/SrfK
MTIVSRRSLITGASATAAAFGLAGCNATTSTSTTAATGTGSSAGWRLTKAPPSYQREEVGYLTEEPPGTIIVDPPMHYLYLVERGGKAWRYGIGVGGEGYTWSGVAVIKSKQEWPDWYPTPDILARQPQLGPRLKQLQGGNGVPGGPENPLGARAFYLWQDNKDTLYRIHGTNEPWTIGQNVSSGCIRMVNDDVIDLYSRTPVGTKVVVLPSRVI